MMDDQFCQTCRFWVLLDSDYEKQEGSFGECMRYPPRVLSHDNTYGFIPVTTKEWWCGEWQLEEDVDELKCKVKHTDYFGKCPYCHTTLPTLPRKDK